MKLHTIRFDYEFEHASPYNTTDVSGVKNMIKILTQVRNVMNVQYYFNVEEKLEAKPESNKGIKTNIQITPMDT